ncbi:MAG: tannase/feruloyl esterase family alpha/beta hydrolase [Syntrophorhabdales bacterium]|jgi:feruloyl esterase
MRIRLDFAGCVTLVACVLLTNCSSVGSMTGAPALSSGKPVACTDIKNLSYTDQAFGKSVTISSAVVIPAAEATVTSPALPELCEVRGTIWPEIGFVVKMPATGWNNRFYQVGTGGSAGMIFEWAMPPALTDGFAVAGTDTGHKAKAGYPLGLFDLSWAYNPPDNSNPLVEQKKIDHFYRAQHETAVLAKKIVKAYYGGDARYSYFVGCSNGGREGLLEAQKYPEDFNGIIAGAPMFTPPWGVMQWVWNARQMTGAGWIDPVKLPLLSAVVLAKCDGLDGVVDGLIDDPRKCKFNALTDLAPCPQDADAPKCFTSAQRKAIFNIYDGPRTSDGRLLYPGTAFGSETIAFDPVQKRLKSGWEGQNTAASVETTLNVITGNGMFQYLVFIPAPGPSWNYTMFNFDTDPERMAVRNDIWRADRTDMRTFKAKGGKIILWHGTADNYNSPYWSYKYYDAVRADMGTQETAAFMKFYTVPGAFHCRGGVGCFTSDALWIKQLVDWVEKGVEPGTIIGARPPIPALNLPARSRPFCPYLQIAVYKGSGSIDEAANFSCVNPAPRP